MNKNFIVILVSLFFISLLSCEDTNSVADITYKSVNKEFVFIRDINMLQQSDDQVSNHIDSIINGHIDAQFISTGYKEFDLLQNDEIDIAFEIIDLNEFNQNHLPESFDSLAARVDPLKLEIIDNSTYGYPDALSEGDIISENAIWSSNTSVLGTFLNSGQFQGKGEKYLGIRFPIGDQFKYGWIKIYCSQHNDTLRIIEYAYNNIENVEINAGQK
jgi:hypothetical protein